MTNAQKIFCDEYLIDLNATRAYKVAYPKCKKDDSARKAGSRLLTIVDIQEYISEKIKEREQRTEVTQDMVVQELAKIAFFNIKKVYDENGKLKPISELDDNTARAISSIKILQKAGSMKIEINPNGKDNEVPISHIDEQTVEIKTNDKKGALELLGRHLGMFNDKLKVDADTTINNNPFANLSTEELRQLIKDE